MDKITLAHGSGGRLMHELIDSLFIKELDNEIVRKKKDAATFKFGNKELAFTTDSYVVNPIFFPGGDIGSLAVHGTVNDLSVCGARPLFISVAMIIEEGFDRRSLERITRSIKIAAKRSGVKVVTGDFKVVEKSSCDKIFINTPAEMTNIRCHIGLARNSQGSGDFPMNSVSKLSSIMPAIFT